MLELTMLACLLSDPNVCKDVPLVGEMTTIQCLLQSQAEAAKWIEAHPGWRIAKVTCGRLGRFAKA